MVAVSLDLLSPVEYGVWLMAALRFSIFLCAVFGFGYCDTIVWVLYEYNRASWYL
jgi:hypothetical protein